METKVIVLNDFHYSVGKPAAIAERRGDYGDILLLRAIHRINRFIKPDLVILGGDLVDDGNTDSLKALKAIIDLLEMPVLVLPGNHDCDVDEFFQIFSGQPDYLDINDCRFIPFYDAEKPGYNAERSQADLERLGNLARNFSGPVISCQHVPLFQSETVQCPYNLTNAEAVIEVMKESGAAISISAHYHSGFFNGNQPFGVSMSPPALCEKPFLFGEAIIHSDSSVHYRIHSLALPEELQLFDCHVHSHYAYCNENMDFAKSTELAKMFNINKIAFSEHTAHLYFNRDDYSHKLPFSNSFAAPLTERIEDFLADTQAFKSKSCLVGFEVDCDFAGKPLIKENHLKQADIIIGSIHALPAEACQSEAEMKACFQHMLATFVQYPMSVLAHPFRAFRRHGADIPRELFPFVASLLKKYNIAAEVNFHTNEPAAEFFEICFNEGVKIALGSDAHNLYEVGEFYPHLEFLKSIGFTNDVKLLL